jgi:hypothetical protein
VGHPSSSISDVSLDFLAWQDGRTLGEDPLPEKTWAALRLVPYEFAGVGALMTAVYWVIERRRKIAREQAEANARQDEGRGDHVE